MSTPTRQPQRAAHRRADILAAARDRFAADGIGAVTMGDIAATAGVSPGNLYYWFRAKSDVVHALYDEWSDASRPAVPSSASPEQLLAFLWDREESQQQVSSRYDFFARDLLPLLHSDPVLRERYRAHYLDEVASMRALLARVVDAGLLRDDADIDSLIRIGWMASELGGPWRQLVDPDGDPARHSQALIALALTPSGRDALEKRS
jgi:AcrR family transcriptional regulator